MVTIPWTPGAISMLTFASRASLNSSCLTGTPSTVTVYLAASGCAGSGAGGRCSTMSGIAPPARVCSTERCPADGASGSGSGITWEHPAPTRQSDSATATPRLSASPSIQCNDSMTPQKSVPSPATGSDASTHQHLQARCLLGGIVTPVFPSRKKKFSRAPRTGAGIAEERVYPLCLTPQGESSL